MGAAILIVVVVIVAALIYYFTRSNADASGGELPPAKDAKPADNIDTAQNVTSRFAEKLEQKENEAPIKKEVSATPSIKKDVSGHNSIKKDEGGTTNGDVSDEKKEKKKHRHKHKKGKSKKKKKNKGGDSGSRVSAAFPQENTSAAAPLP